MNATELLDRRQHVVNEHKILERVQGSGFHKSDPSVRDTPDAHLPTLSQRPVGIQDDDVVYFVGPCVPLVREALKKFLELNVGTGEKTIEGFSNIQSLTMIQHARKIADLHFKRTDEVIEVSTQDFNAITLALTSVGLPVVLTGVS